MSPVYLTPAEAADRLGLTESTVRKQAQAKSFPHHKVGRLLRFTETDLERIESLTAVEPANPFQTTRPKRRAS